MLETSDSNEQSKNGTYASKAKLRKEIRKMRNGPGRNHLSGGRVEKSKGFLPNSFDRVLLDAPCSALGLRPRLFTREVGMLLKVNLNQFINLFIGEREREREYPTLCFPLIMITHFQLSMVKIAP